jgi:hypothetical protein
VLLVLLVLVPHYSHLHWPGRRALRQCHIGVFHRRKAKGRTCPSSEIRGHQFSILGPSRPHKILASSPCARVALAETSAPATAVTPAPLPANGADGGPQATGGRAAVRSLPALRGLLQRRK